MTSEGSRDSEDWSIDAEYSAFFAKKMFYTLMTN